MWQALIGGLASKMMQGRPEADMGGALNQMESGMAPYMQPTDNRVAPDQDMPEAPRSPYGGNRNLGAVMQQLAQRYGGGRR